ncbi:MAG: hypothetical protein IJP82_01560 [Bacteroidaceae bacterium]|nr:hypothetical protein [Bacteroidaceae bacterium]
MKKKAILIATFAVATLTASAATAQNDGIITIKTHKAGRALVEKWIEAYKTVNPDVEIAVVSGRNADADLTLVSGHQKGAQVTRVGRYALLPVTSTGNPLLSDIQRKEWRSKDLKRLFFTTEDLDEEYEEEAAGKHNKLKDKLTVYSGSGKASFSPVFAAHFGRTADDLRGNHIAGDDLYLLSAISDDKASVTFNVLSNLYNLSTRTLRSDLALLPLDVKKTQSEVLLSGNLDETLELIEREDIDLIPVEDIGFTYTAFDRDIDHFLQWIVRNGQQYNHAAGFLRLTEQEVESQLHVLTQTLNN